MAYCFRPIWMIFNGLLPRRNHRVGSNWEQIFVFLVCSTPLWDIMLSSVVNFWAHLVLIKCKTRKFLYNEMHRSYIHVREYQTHYLGHIKFWWNRNNLKYFPLIGRKWSVINFNYLQLSSLHRTIYLMTIFLFQISLSLC